MNLKRVKISELVANPENYNTHPAEQLEALEKSLKAFGQFKNVVVCRGRIVAGHGIIEAARRAGMVDIWAAVMDDLTPDQERALMIADNATAALSLPDIQALDIIINRVEIEIPGIENYLEKIGHKKIEIAAWAGSADDPEPERAELVRVYQLSCFFGAYYIKPYSEIDTEALLAFKARPGENMDFAESMVKDFLKVWDARKTRVDFVTVPPASLKRGVDFDDYPAAIVAKKFSERAGINFEVVFESRAKKSRRGRGYRSTGEDSEKFVVKSIPEGGAVALVVDDIVTTRETFKRVHSALTAAGVTPFCLAWGYWDKRKGDK